MQDPPKITQLQGWGIAILRVVTGSLFLASGVNNLSIAYFFGDPGSSLTLWYIFLVGSPVELFCGAALAVGLLTRWVSVPLAILMLTDIAVFHPPDESIFQDRGFEYASLRLGASVALALTSPGKVALDNVLALRRRPRQV